jgi:hypothetical protein
MMTLELSAAHTREWLRAIGQSENRFERIYPKGGPEVATFERLPSADLLCERRFI